MDTLTFSYNWNQKLYCRSFSTVRIENPKKYILNHEYEVILKPKGNKAPVSMGIAVLKHISHFYLFSVNPGISYIDSNLAPDDFKKLVWTMYKAKNIDWNITRLSFLVFQYLLPTTPERNQID